ncbi:MASE3 domain-containing protein [Zhaonella formicivorans]|uniref:MASE3 domain-containing protein n=1 Tax=Zhaonella formicivorans TaxID=2528593 RepID=UPI0010EF4860|nr:MASE3 domain-containing protein [Zhaonella formicivorans]
MKNLFRPLKEYLPLIKTFASAAAVFLLAKFVAPYFIFPGSSYLEIHTTLELFSVFVALATFAVSWFSYPESKDNNVLILGIGFLSFGLIDYFHTMTYKGMPSLLLLPSSPEKATLFWIIGRLTEACTFLLTAISEKLKPIKINRVLALACSVVWSTAVLLTVSYYPHLLPPMYISGVGLTATKITLEYVVIALNLITLFLLIRRQTSNDLLFVKALLVSIFSELSFTLYISVYDSYNFLGHIYRIITYSLFFQSVFITSVKGPYLEMQYILKSLPLPVLTFSRTGHVQFSNQAFSDFSGYNARELEGLHFTALAGKLFSKEDLPLLRAGNALSSKKITVDHRLHLQHKNGETKPIMVEHYPLLRSGKRQDGILSIFYDLQDKIKLHTFQQRFNFIVDAMQSGLLAVDNSLTITAFNKAAERILGLKAEQVLERNFKDIFPPQSALYILADTFATGTEYKNYPVGIAEANLELDVETSLVKDDIGNTIGAMIIFNDVTALRRLQGKMHRLEKLKLIGEMAACTAHEIKNPLTTIKGFTQVLQKKCDELALHAEKEFASIILSEVDRLNKLLQDYLLLAKQPQEELSEVSLPELLEVIYKMIKAEAVQHNVKVIKKVSDVLPPVSGNPEQLKQVFLNLGFNGLQSMLKEGGTLTISANLTGDFIEIAFHDTGCGIPCQNIPKLFEPFYTTKENGTGLGLPISLKIVQEHGGEIKVESEVGKGSSFKVLLPVTYPKAERLVN